LQAKKLGLKTLTLEQDSLGGTVYTFPRKKIVMTAPMDLPLHGKLKLYETSKQELLDLWNDILGKNSIEIQENKKVDSITIDNGGFRIFVKDGTQYSANKVLLAIGRRGTPRKLNIPGEISTKVAYRLLEPELITGKNIVVVGGGDSAIESAILLADENKVTLSYRSAIFSRLKPRNKQALEELISANKVNVVLNSNLVSIEEEYVNIKVDGNSETVQKENDLVYIFAGGELPTQFLKNVGIEITTKFGEAILKHGKR
jgi:thioredoxin reductase